MPGDAEFSPEHPASPAARIRARLKERRVLEARFLLRQFEDELDAGERQALEQEVSRRLAEVEWLRHQAKTAAAEGRREEAGRLYRDLEQLVVDVPGLPEERAALAGAEVLFSRPLARDAGTAVSAPGGPPALDQDRVKREVLAGKATASQEWQQVIASRALKKAAVRPPRRRGRFLGLWLAVVGCAGLAILALLLWQSHPQAPTATLPPSPEQPPPRDTAIESGSAGVSTTLASAPPLSPEPFEPTAAGPQPEPSHEPPPLPPEPAPIPDSLMQTKPVVKSATVPRAPVPQPTFKLRTLQVKKSKQK